MSYIKPQVACMSDTILRGQPILRFVILFLAPVSISTPLTNTPGKKNKKAAIILLHLFCTWAEAKHNDTAKQEKPMTETPCWTETRCNVVWIQLKALWGVSQGEVFIYHKKQGTKTTNYSQ